jgi:hypothetical protein
LFVVGYQVLRPDRISASVVVEVDTVTPVESVCAAASAEADLIIGYGVIKRAHSEDLDTVFVVPGDRVAQNRVAGDRTTDR